MVRPAENEAVNRAVQMVANGMGARTAWEACGKPNGEKAIQNIRKRGRERRAQAAAPKRKAPEPAAPQKPGKRRRKIYLRPAQQEEEWRRAAAVKEQRKQVFKEATLEVARARSAGTLGRGSDCSATFPSIAAEATKRLPAGAKAITATMLKRHADRKQPGESPAKTGPKKRKLPDAFYEGVGSFAQLKQAGGREQKPRELQRAMRAAVKGTAFEAALDSKSKLNHAAREVRKRSADHLSTLTSKPRDDRRSQWLTTSNVTTWFGGYRSELEKHKFLEPGESEIPPYKRRRMLNMDETHHYMGNGGETRGPRSHALVDTRLGRPGRRKVENSHHITGMHWANYVGEIGAGMYLFTSTAEEPEDRRIKASWIKDLPHPRGHFGLGALTAMKPSVAATPKGGTVQGTLEQFVESQIFPAYPNISPTWEIDESMPDAFGEPTVVRGPVFMQVDSGPDRINENNYATRVRWAKKGFIMFPGLPNGTEGNQLMDGVYGLFKQACDAVADDLVNERIDAAAAGDKSKVALTNDDLARIVNGRKNAELRRLGLEPADEVRPFEQNFSPHKLLTALHDLGLHPVDCARACSHPRVRDDSGEATSRGALVSSIRTRHGERLAELSGAGIATTALEVPAPKPRRGKERADMAPQSETQSAFDRLVDGGVSAGNNWVAVGAKAYTDEMILAAEATRICRNREAELEKEAQKLCDFLRLQLEARAVVSNDLGSLLAKDLATLVKYDFAARGASGASKIGGREACLSHLRRLDDGALDAALADPPCLREKSEQALSSARRLLSSPIADFGDVGFALPRGMVPVGPPPWLPDALTSRAAETARQLTGRSILYKWPTSGWAVGVVGAPNRRNANKVGDNVANFSATYAVDGGGPPAWHYLELQAFAWSAKAPDESWVLLGPAEPEPPQPEPAPAPAPTTQQPRATRSGGEGVQRAVATPAPAPPPVLADDAALEALSEQQKLELMARLGAALKRGNQAGA